MTHALRRTFRRIDWSSPQTRILIGVMAPAVITGMDHHMFGVTVPAIRSHFDLDADTAAWVVMSYSLPFMALMPLYGRMGDRLGKRLLLLIGTAIFFVGSLLAMTAPSLGMFMAGRFVQGMGAAGFVPLCIALITQRFPAAERGRALGTWNSVVPLAGLMLPYFAGLLVDALSWRAIFPAIALTAVIGFFTIRHNIRPLTTAVDFRFLRTFDWPGVILLSSALVTLFFYTSSRPVTGRPALQDWRLLLAWPLLFTLLILWERRRPDPYIDLGLFRNRTFSVASLCAGLRMALMTSVSFLIPLYVSDVHGGNASVIGIVLMLQAGMLFVTSRAGGQLADRWGGRLPVAGGMAGLAVVMALMAILPETAPLWAVVAVTMGHGLMIGMSLAPLHRAAMQGIDDADTGLAAGLYSMIRFGGQIMGTAIAGVLLQAGLERYAAPVQAYQSVFWIFAGVALLATFAAWQIREA